MAISEVTNDSAFPAPVLRARAKQAPLAARDRATEHLRGALEGAAGGNQVRGSAMPRGLCRGCTGSEPSQRSASSNDSTPKGSGPGLARSPSYVLSPAGFMPSEAGPCAGHRALG